MMSAPVIGITVSLDHGERLRAGHEYLYVKRAYARAVASAGGRPVLLSPELAPAAVAEICDGLVISGGDDIPPELYGESAAARMQPESRERIHWERRLLDLFAQGAAPLLGVCYGMQLINIHFGGTLVQDIPSLHLFHVDYRHKKIGREKLQCPTEPGRRNTDYCKRMLVKLNNPAHHPAIAFTANAEVSFEIPTVTCPLFRPTS